MTSEYLIDVDLIKNERQSQENSEIAKSLKFGAAQDPDSFAKTLDLEKRTGIPRDVVGRNTKEAEDKANPYLIDTDLIKREVPELNEWIKEPENAGIVGADFSILGRIKKTLSDVPESIARSDDRMNMINLAALEMEGKATPESVAALDAALEFQENNPLGTGGIISDMVVGAGENLVPMAMTATESIKGGLATGLAFGATTALAGQLIPAPEEVITVPTAGAAGFLVGSRAFGVKESIRQVSADSYMSLRQIRDEKGNRIDPVLARNASYVAGFATGPLEYIGFTKIVKTIPGTEGLVELLAKEKITDILQNKVGREIINKAGRAYVEAVATEGATEAAQQAAQILAENWAIAKENDENFAFFERKTLGDAAGEVARAAVVGGGVGGIYSTPGTATRSAMEFRDRRYRNPDSVRDQVQKINESMKSGDGATLYQRSPEKFHKMIDHLTGDQRFYVNAEELNLALSQLPAETQEEIFARSPDLRVEIETASVSGNDVSIKKSDYTAFIAPHEASEMLVDHIKLDPADLSAAERASLQTFLQENPELAGQLNTMNTQNLPPAPQEMYESVERVVRKALTDAGRSTTEARAVAPLFARTLSRFAAPFGENAVDVLNQGLIQFQTVSEDGTIAKRGSNYTQLLGDYEKISAGKKVRNLDAQSEQAINDFGERLKAAGLTVEEAKTLTPEELFDRVGPEQTDPQNTISGIDLGALVDITPQEVLQYVYAAESSIPAEMAPLIDTVRTMMESSGLTPDQVASIDVGRLQSFIDQAIEQLRAREAEQPLFQPAGPTDSDAFKAWFGDSKVVDASGAPLVVYHGTRGDFEAFDIDKAAESADRVYDIGFHFGTQEQANNRIEGKGNIIPVYLSLKNPIRMDETRMGSWRPNQVMITLRQMAFDDEVDFFTDEEIDDFHDDVLMLNGENYFDIFDEARERQFLVDLFKSKGVDGIVYANAVEGDGDSYIVFDPTQVKSVHNQGTFDANNPNILYQSGGLVPATDLKIDLDQVNMIGSEQSLETPEQKAAWNTLVDIRQKLWDSQYLPYDAIDATDPVDSIDDIDASYIEEFLNAAGEHIDIQDLYDENLEEAQDGGEVRDFIADTDNVLDWVIAAKGTTENIALAGYIMPEGELLDFSGGQGQRYEDHRQLNIPEKGDITGTDLMEAFISHGAVRTDGNKGAMTIGLRPTRQQFEWIEQIIDEAGEAYITMYDGDRQTYIVAQDADTAVDNIRKFYRGVDVQGDVFFQKERGSIQFNKYAEANDFAGRLRNVIIQFTERANASTAMHEFSHWGVATHRMFAQMARERMEKGDTSEEMRRIVQDWEALKNRVGADGDVFTVEQEEQIASLFEAYMREGKAPSEGLRRVFSRFREWLLKIYTDVTDLGVELDDEVRGIFNRWLASEEEIAAVNEKNSSLSEIAKNLGLPENITDRIANYVNSAMAVAEETLYKGLTREKKRRETKAYKDAFARVREDVKAEFEQRRNYALIKYLEENKRRIYLGSSMYEDMLGQAPVDDTPVDVESTPITLEDLTRLHAERDETETLRQAVIEVLLSKSPPKPKSLAAFLVEKGGVWDQGGELANLGITNKTRPGLLRGSLDGDAQQSLQGVEAAPARTGVDGKGRSLDYARELAVEAGYMSEDSTMDDFIQVLGQDLFGEAVYSDQDAAGYEYIMHEQRLQEADRIASELNIDIEAEKRARRKYGAYAYLITFEPSTKGAFTADDVADLFGYDSGMTMIRDLKKTPGLERAVDRETRRRLMDEYPDMIESGRIKENATEAVMNDRVLLALDLMVKELGKQYGSAQRASMKQYAKIIARAQVEKMKMKDVNYSFRYEVGRDKEMRLALVASRDGDAAAAMLHLQRAMINQTIYKSLEEFKGIRDKAQDLFYRVDRKDEKLAKSRDMEWVEGARHLLWKFGLGGEQHNMQEWLSDLQERNPDLQEDLFPFLNVNAQPNQDAGELTTAEYLEVYNSVKNLFSVARQLHEIEREGRKVKTQEAVNEMIDLMDLEKHPISQSTQVVGKDRVRMVISTAKASLRRVEMWTKSMDGGDTGPFRKYLWDTISNAEDQYTAARAKWMAGYRDILKKNKKRLNERVKIDSGLIRKDSLGRSTKMVWNDRMEMIGFLLHTGNESNLDKLLGGYGIEADTYYNAIRSLEERNIITKEDWVLVQELWDYMEKIVPLMQSAHKNLYGYRVQLLDPKPVESMHGTFKGGYWPAQADAEQSANNKTVQQQIENTRQYMMATTTRGFTKGRVAGYREPLKTDLRLGSQHIDKVLRFVYLEPAARDMRYLVRNQDFKAALKAIDPDVYEGMILPFLQRFAQQITEQRPQLGDRGDNAFMALMRGLRSSATSQLIRYNPLTAIQNFANLGVAFKLVGPREFARAAAIVTVNPISAHQKMVAASTMMANRFDINAQKVQHEISEIAARKGKFRQGKNFLVRNGWIFMMAVDSYVSSVTWIAAYNKFQTENPGRPEGEVIQYADARTREVIGGMGSKDMSKFEAGHPVISAFIAPFMGYFNSQANLVGSEFAIIMRKHGWAGTHKLFYAFAMMVIVPAVMAAILRDATRAALPEDDDDDGDVLDDWLAYTSGETLKYMGAMIPVGSPVISAAVNRWNDNPMDDRITASPPYSLTEGAIKTVADLIAVTKGEDVDDSALIRRVMYSTGFMTGLPIGQLGKPLSYIADVNEGESEADSVIGVARGLIAGPKPQR